MSRFWKDWSPGKNWAMGIVASLIVSAIGGGARMFFQWKPPDPPPAVEKAGPSKRAEEPEFSGLPVEQIPARISAVLRLGDVDRAFGLLQEIPSGSAKDDECEHVFAFCAKELELDHARRVVDECWTGPRRKAALQEIALAKVKSPEFPGRTP